MLVTADPLLWEELLERPPAARRGAAPRELIDFIGRHNEADGRPLAACTTRTAPGSGSGSGSAILHANLDAAIAVRCVVAGPEGDLIGAAVAIDAAAFADITASVWFERRQNMPFEGADGIRLEARIAEPAHDYRVAALQFVLLHAFGHVLAACKALAPMWWRPAAPSYPLLDLCWQVAPNGRFTPRAGHDFPQRGRLVQHGVPRLSLRDPETAYAALRHTGFATLHASTSVHEDTADSFAGHVHVRLMGRPLARWLLRADTAVPRGAPTCTCRHRRPLRSAWRKRHGGVASPRRIDVMSSRWHLP